MCLSITLKELNDSESFALLLSRSESREKEAGGVLGGLIVAGTVGESTT